jgi:hypothetical protein
MQLRKPRQPRQITWKSFLLLFVILGIAGVLKVKQTFFDGPRVPTANVPSVSYDEVDDVKSVEDTGPTHGSAPTHVDTIPNPEPTTDSRPPTTDNPPSATVPTTFNLAVPFTSQAPYGNWDALHEDACEEASFYMAMQFFDGNKTENLDAATTDKVLYDMVDKETALSMGYSISAAEAVTFIASYTDDFKAKIVENPTADDIKKLVSQGIPVIVPAAGRELHNPFFTGEGPLYHMLLIRGYTADSFITNDPGTRHGKNYTYKIPVLMSAIGDWNNGNPPDGASRIIILEPVNK